MTSGGILILSRESTYQISCSLNIKAMGLLKARFKKKIISFAKPRPRKLRVWLQSWKDCLIVAALPLRMWPVDDWTWRVANVFS